MKVVLSEGMMVFELVSAMVLEMAVCLAVKLMWK